MSFIFFAAAAVYLLFNASIPVTDPVEANYALTAKEMLLSGDWLSPRIYGQYWYDKPAMIYWLIIFSYKLFGVNEFAARFPSALFSALSVSFIYWFVQRIYADQRTAMLSALVLGTSLQFWILAKMIITDACLFFFVSVALATFYLGLLGQGKKWFIVAYASSGLAVLTKGPVGIVLPALVIFTYILVSRRWALFKQLSLISGMTVFGAIVLPWYFYMYKAHGAEFINTFLGLHNYIRATVAEHPKDNVFYYYLVLFPLSLLPWTGLFLKALGSLAVRSQAMHERFLWVWAAVILVFFTMMATKYPTYVFPALFPAAIITGRYMALMQNNTGRTEWLWLTIPAGLLFAGLAIGLKYLKANPDWFVVYSLSGAAIIALIWLQIRGNSRLMPAATALAVAALSLVISYYGFSAYADARSAKALITALPKEGAIVASYGDYPTSAVFYSDYLVIRLVTSEESIKARGIWAGKYTMPTEPEDVFYTRTLTNPATYVVVNAHDQQPFQAKLQIQNFVPVSSHGKMTLYKREL